MSIQPACGDCGWRDDATYGDRGAALLALAGHVWQVHGVAISLDDAGDPTAAAEAADRRTEERPRRSISARLRRLARRQPPGAPEP